MTTLSFQFFGDTLYQGITQNFANSISKEFLMTQKLGCAKKNHAKIMYNWSIYVFSLKLRN